MSPTLLKDLKIKEVSSVDRGAGEGVSIMLMKRFGAEDKYTGFDAGWADWFNKNVGSSSEAIKKSMDEADEYLKREFSADDRKELASSGKALPDGSFPIETRADLENAVHAYGRASDKAKAKAHIIARAKALGCTDCLPDDWKVEKGALRTATSALLKSALSIFNDKGTSDKAAALAEQFEKFEEHIEGLVVPDVTKVVEDHLKRGKEADMTEEEKKKLADAEKEKKDHEETKKALAIAKRELSLAKMSQKHKDYMASSNMSDDDKDKFADKTPDERDDHMSKNPVEKSLPEYVQKALAKAEENDKILKALQEKDEIATFEKRATDLGLPASHGVVMRKAYSGDAEAIKKHEEMMKGLVEQVRTGKVFQEFGKAGGGDADQDAGQQLRKRAADYRSEQTKIGKKCSSEQAWTAVYTDPANRDLKKEYDNEEARRRAKALASAA